MKLKRMRIAYWTLFSFFILLIVSNRVFIHGGNGHLASMTYNLMVPLRVALVIVSAPYIWSTVKFKRVKREKGERVVHSRREKILLEMAGIMSMFFGVFLVLVGFSEFALIPVGLLMFFGGLFIFLQGFRSKRETAALVSQ